jgi:hypothetical protein
MKNSFKEFVNKKTRQAKKQLETIKKILVKGGMQVQDFLTEEEPYIYLKSISVNLPFDGVRIYKIGDNLAYRVQKEARTHPYGKAYDLDIEGMYNDLISDEMDEQKAGSEIIKAVREEFRNFFNKSLQADKEIRADDMQYRNDPMGKTSITGTTGTDYSSMITGTRTYSPL